MKEPIRDMIEKRPHLNLLEESFPGIKANIIRCETIGFPWESTPFLKEGKEEILFLSELADVLKLYRIWEDDLYSLSTL